MSEDKPTLKKLKHLLMWPVFHLYLKPLIKRNYRLRALGELPDKWYWADATACNYGYYVSNESMNMWKRLAALLRKKANSMRRRRAVDVQCPVCGYYCIGHGGFGCVHKDTMPGISRKQEDRKFNSDLKTITIKRPKEYRST